MLSLHILSGAEFGKSYLILKFAETFKEINYRYSLALFLENKLVLLIFGSKFLTKKWLPERMRSLGQANVEFKSHMAEMVKDEKQLIHQGKSGS